jgi:hypothetical protein
MNDSTGVSPRDSRSLYATAISAVPKMTFQTRGTRSRDAISRSVAARRRGQRSDEEDDVNACFVTPHTPWSARFAPIAMPM